MAPADAIRQGPSVHPVDVSSGDFGFDMRECHYSFLVGEADGLEESWSLANRVLVYGEGLLVGAYEDLDSVVVVMIGTVSEGS